MARTSKQLSEIKPQDITEKDWQSRDDARTLAAALLIKADVKRHAEAKLWAGALAMQENEQRDALTSVAND